MSDKANSSKSHLTLTSDEGTPLKTDHEDMEDDRGNWDNKIEYLLSSIGYAVGLGNVWRFPYLCYKNGGGAFLLPYLIVLAICGLPIFLLESSIGQFCSQGPVRAFNGMPVFKGLGFAMLCVSTFVAPYYNVILSWAIYYLWKSFGALFSGNELPWKNCPGKYCTPTNCTETQRELYAKCYDRDRSMYCKNLHDKIANDTISSEEITTAQVQFENKCEYYELRKTSVDIYYDNVLGINRDAIVGGFNETLLMYNSTSKSYYQRPSYNGTSKPVSDIPDIDLSTVGGIQWHLVLTLGLSWLFIGLSILKGVKSSGKTMYVTATFPYVVLTILLIRGVLLDGAFNGIKFFIEPKLEKLLDGAIWKDAVIQIFYSLSVSWGGLLTLSSYNPFRNNVYRDTYIVVCANSATSVYAGFAIFSYLGFMADLLKVEVEDVVSSGPGLAFIIWPEAMTHLGTGWVCAMFSIIFFLMLYSLGISTMIVTVETICTSFMDIFPKFRKSRPKIVFILIGILYAIGIPLVCANGIYYFTVFDDYSASYSLIVSAIVEMVAAHWFYGMDRISSDVKMMTGRAIPPFFKIMWGYVTPSVLSITLVYNVIKHTSPTETVYGVRYTYPWFTNILAGFLVLCPLALMVGLGLRELKRHGNWADAVRPTNHWGPLKDSDRLQFNDERNDGRVYETHKELRQRQNGHGSMDTMKNHC